LERNPKKDAQEIIEVTQEELTRASLQKAPQEVLAVFEQPTYDMDMSAASRSLCLALDDVQDPGNMGTIIRLADWFGIEHIYCSQGTVDVYNPKTVQATMGALARVKLHYCHLPAFIGSLKDVPVYGTFLDGENMYGKELSAHGLIVMGNEGNGISDEVAQLVNERLYIPNYPPQRETSESLNVAIATSVICAEFRRRITTV
jgi:TrmH family RNA methyltransferase